MCRASMTASRDLSEGMTIRSNFFSRWWKTGSLTPAALFFPAPGYQMRYSDAKRETHLYATACPRPRSPRPHFSLFGQ